MKTDLKKVSDKLSDIALIYEEYKNELCKRFLTCEDLLSALEKKLNESDFLNNSYVFFDECSYTSYSPSELEPFRYEPQYLRAFYTQTVTDFIIPMLKKHSGSAFVQYIMLYLIETAFSLNADA